MPTIHLKQWPTPIVTRRGTVLDAALKAGVPYPHACRSGECGRCKSVLHSGTVAPLPGATDALNPEEQKAGLILACRSVPESDVELDWLMTESDASQMRRATVVGLQAMTHDVTCLRLSLDGPPLAFKAGQYALLGVGSLPARAYSMANAPEDPVLEFHVRHVPGGAASGYIARELKVGDTVEVDGAHGNAYLRDAPEQPMLLAAGGTGLAPMLSILRTALGSSVRRAIHLYHGVREARDLYAVELLELLGAYQRFSYIPVLSASSAPGTMRAGFLHAAIERDFPSLAGHVVYTAGPPPMVEAVKSVVRPLGVRAQDIHADAFHSSAPERPAGNGLARAFSRLFGKASP